MKTYRNQSKRFIYLLKCENFFKIGMSLKVLKRFSVIKHSCPFPVELICYGLVTNGADYERNLKEKYKHLRNKGEWFRFCETSFNEIKNELLKFSTKKTQVYSYTKVVPKHMEACHERSKGIKVKYH